MNIVSFVAIKKKVNVMKKKHLLLFLLGIHCTALTQSLHQSLQDSSYHYLMESFYDFRMSDPEKAKIFAEAYYRKAKAGNQIKNLFDAMFYKSLIQKDDSIYLNYVDSVIVSSKAHPTTLLPAIAYEDKYIFYFEKEIRDKALSNLMYAFEYSSRSKNDSLNLIYSFRLGLYKTRLTNFNEALKLFELVTNYYDKKNSIYNKNLYISAMLAKSQVYIIGRNFKESDSILAKVQKFLDLNELNKFDGYVYKQKALIAFNKEKYTEAIKLFTSSITSLIEDENFKELISTHYNISKSYKNLNLIHKSIKHCKIIDSIQSIYNLNNPSVTYAYDQLRLYYKSTGAKDKEIEYLEKLITAEKRLTKTHDNFSREMTEKYNIPRLVQEKERLITSLQSEITQDVQIKYGLMGMVGIAALTLILFYKRQRKLKAKFEEIVNLQGQAQIPQRKTQQKLNLPSETISYLQKKLDTFEKDKKFTSTRVSLNSLAREFKTNTNYLSKFINAEKGCNFSQYLNDLRIHHAIQTLKKDTRMRKYTIKAIANDMGYRNAESFAKAFQSKTGLKPSYYIQQLNKMP